MKPVVTTIIRRTSEKVTPHERLFQSENLVLLFEDAMASRTLPKYSEDVSQAVSMDPE